MAFCECSFFSEVLGRVCSMNVIVPQPTRTQIGVENSAGEWQEKYPVVYLLHGLSDNHSIWMRHTSIERYAAKYRAVVVMPDGGRGFYTDMKCGDQWWTMLSEELPEIVRGIFPVSGRREDTFAAGLSMGGYGALKLALRKPESFAGAAALSAVADIMSWRRRSFALGGEKLAEETKRIFGTDDEGVKRDGNDLLTEAEKIRSGGKLPRIFMSCGTEDFLYEENRTLRRHFEKLSWPDFCYRERPGVHDWGFWDCEIQTAFEYLLGGK